MPFFEKANRILFFLIAVFLLLYYLDGFLIPLTFGIFFAMLILPFTLFLERYKLSAALSAIISTLLLFILVGGLTFLFISQIMQFAEQLPDLQDEVQAAVERLQQQIASSTGILPDEQQDMAEDRVQDIWEAIESHAASFIGGLLGFSFSFLLVFIYTFLLQLYREKFVRYAISSYTTTEEKENARHAINQISKVVYQYLWGRIQVMTALAVMYYTAFLIFGLPFALLITLSGALMTIVPYIGPLVSGVIPITVGLIFFEDLPYTLIFSAIIIIIHLIESYVLEPVIIGKELKLNALGVIITILLGGIIWGVPGMILFVPVIAMIKIISIHSEAFRPLGDLLDN